MDARLRAACALLFVALFLAAPAQAFNLQVTGADGEKIRTFRWVVEEDVNIQVTPGAATADSLTSTFHKSHMPVALSGTEADVGLLNNPSMVDPAKRYFISVRAESGYTIGGAPVAPGQKTVSVTLNPLPLPTAQISILAFEDTAPINNAWDTGEPGLEGFTVILSEAGGRYGHNGGQVIQDAFGNPLGTTYNPDGSLKEKGTGIIKTGADGRVTIKNLVPAKYGIEIQPPPGYVQTTTIEGTRTIDAWVKPAEPEQFFEFGPPDVHVFMGFVPTDFGADTLGRSGMTVSGQVVNKRMSALPNLTFHAGAPFAHTTCWIGLNDMQVGTGRGVVAKRCDEDGLFTITGVQPGQYQLVVWDDYLDLVIHFAALTVTADGCNGASGCELGQVPVFNWFTGIDSRVFLDANENGIRDCITEDCNDAAAGDEIGLPEQMVTLRFRDGSIYQQFATDHEGFVPFDEIFPFFNWQVVEVDFARHKATGATIVVDAGGPTGEDQGWDYPSYGKLAPQVHPEVNPRTGNRYTRTVEGPVLTQAFQGMLGQTSVVEWGKAPYAQGENGGISGIVYYATTRAEDDPRYAGAEPWEPGVPRVQVNLYEDFDADGLADGPAVASTSTDSWDDNLPTGCLGENVKIYAQPVDCFDGIRRWNQVRDGVFDGGYAFDGLEPGTYIVEVVPPRGYEIVREESKNVDFGETYVPAPELLPPPCVGTSRPVPQYLTFSRDERIEAPFAGQMRPLCDRKQVRLNDQANAAADFFLYTETPIAAHIVGRILDDLHNEFVIDSMQFGEKYAPPFLPVAVRDFTGRELARAYADEWGAFNLLVPSTYTVNAPSPSGMGPNMLVACMNDAGPILDEKGNPVPDPFHRPQYSQFCYTFQYMPGTTTYLDTPVLPVAAFAGYEKQPLDCELPDGTPRIKSATGQCNCGPYAPKAKEKVTILSEGLVEVPNPYYGGDGQPRTVLRDYGFGAQPGAVTLNGMPLPIKKWGDAEIVVEVPAGAQTGQLMVSKADGRTSQNGVTLTVGAAPYRVVTPSKKAGATPIQNAIDAAAPGDLILVAPGVYDEPVVMWKPVRLQGWGAGVTYLRAAMTPDDRVEAWAAKVRDLAAGAIDLLPGQTVDKVAGEAAPAVAVFAKQGAFANRGARIDGFTIAGAHVGGGILVNGYADDLTISNNLVVGNQGIWSGGIRLGHPNLFIPADQPEGERPGAENRNIRISYNRIQQNGALGGAGGGVSMCAGSQAYQVTDNWICGNFSLGNGGGISHLGYSDGGLIARNAIIYNQVFNQQLNTSGGGIYLAGEAPDGEHLSFGSGNVAVEDNLIQGNQAGSGDGGGIRLNLVNGRDVAENPFDPDQWHAIGVHGNVIVNNVAGLAGGGISLQDALKVSVTGTTIAHNDSTATAADAFGASWPNQSTAQPAGIVSRAHGLGLQAALTGTPFPDAGYSNPVLDGLIVWQNRSFHFSNTDAYSGLVAEGYRDLDVLGTAGQLVVTNSTITEIPSGQEAGNSDQDPGFANPRINQLSAHLAVDEGGHAIDVRIAPLTVGDSDYGTTGY